MSDDFFAGGAVPYRYNEIPMSLLRDWDPVDPFGAWIERAAMLSFLQAAADMDALWRPLTDEAIYRDPWL